MTKFAVDFLENEEGFFLMVEGAWIDKYSHDNLAHQAMCEVRSLIDTIEFLYDYARDGETAIFITADHETGGLKRLEAEQSLSASLYTTGNHTGVNVPLFIKNYKMNYPDIDRYLEQVVKDADRDGFTTTTFGRRRYIPEIHAQNGNMRAFGRRVAMNAPIQGTATDIMKLAMLRVSEALKRENLDATIVMQVHDELVVEVRDDQVEKCMKIVKSEMENATKLSIPLTVDVTCGKNWLDQE
jgi:hypothetical protein